MSLQRIGFVFLTLGMWAPVLHAKPACDAVLDIAVGRAAPKTLKLRSERVAVPQELPLAGHVLAPEPSQALAHLPAGKYIYLVLRDGTVLWSPRAPAPLSKAQQFVATHTSLLRQAEAVYGKAQVAGAGEFYIFEDGRGELLVTLLNNKSGAFWGDSTHLNFSEAQLAKQGLAIQAHTRRQDLSLLKRADEHLADARAATLTLRYAQNPKLATIREDLLLLRRQLVTRYPDPKRLGHFSVQLIFPKELKRKMELDQLSTVYEQETFLQRFNDESIESALESVERLLIDKKELGQVQFPAAFAASASRDGNGEEAYAKILQAERERLWPDVGLERLQALRAQLLR